MLISNIIIWKVEKSELEMLKTKITKWKYGFDKTKILLTDSWIAAAILQ
jgi:hypothetical protein